MPLLSNWSRSYKFSAYSIIFSPSASFTYAFFQSRRYPSFWPRRRILPTKFAVRTAATFTLKICCTASLISVLVAFDETSKTTVCCVSFTPRPFSVMIRCRILRCGFWRSFFFRRLWRGRNRLYVRHHDGLLLRIERVAQPRHRILREHHQVMFQHVVRLQNARRRQRHAINIAARDDH